MGSRFATVGQQVGLLVLRVVAGVLMMTHGWPKAQMVFNGQFDKFPDPIGLGNTASLILAAGAEFLCALLVVVGLGTRLVSIPLIITMLVAGFVAHAQDPLQKKELAFLYLAVFTAIALTGPGKLSLDALICRRTRQLARAQV